MGLGTRRSPHVSKRARLKDFVFEEHFGISRLTDRIATPEQYFWTIKNAFVTKSNFIKQRNGYTELTPASIGSTTKIRKMFEAENKTGGKVVIVRAGTAWYRLNGTALTSLDGSRDSDVKGQVCQFNNQIIMADGGQLRKSDFLWSVSNVGASAPSSVSACHTHNHRLVVNNDDNNMEVYISKVDELDFDTATNDAIVLNLSKIIPGGDKVLGFSTFLETYLVIWMRHHTLIYNVPTTFADISLQQVLNVGTVSVDSIDNVGGDLYFASDSGIKSLAASLGTRNTMDIKDVSKLIDPHYRSSVKSAITDLTDINGVFYPLCNHYYFTLPYANSPEVWAISKDLEVATGGKGNIGGYFTGITAYSFLYRKDGTILFGSDNGKIYTMDSGTSDDGAAIPFEVEKTGIYFGNPKINKAVKEMEMYLEATADLTATLEYDYGISGSTSQVQSESITITTDASPWDTSPWDTSSWDANGQLTYSTHNLLGRGKLMNIKLKHSTLNALLSFPYWILSAYMEGDK